MGENIQNEEKMAVRLSFLTDSIFEDMAFSSDHVIGISGQRKALSKKDDLKIRDLRVELILKLIDHYSIDGSDLVGMFNNPNIPDVQKRMLSETVRDLITNKDSIENVTDELKMSMLLSRPESDELVNVNGAHDVSKENEILLAKIPTMMNTIMAKSILSTIQNNTDGFDGVGVYGESKMDVVRNLCEFIYNADMSTGSFTNLNSIQEYQDLIHSSGLDDFVSELSSGKKNSQSSLTEAKLDISSSSASIELNGGSHRVNVEHIDVSKMILEMEETLGLKADITLTRFGAKIRAAQRAGFAVYADESIQKIKLGSDYDATEFKRKRAEFDGSFSDRDIAKVAFRNKDGKTLIETIGRGFASNSRGVQLSNDLKSVSIKPDVANLMVLQFTKMNPKMDRLSIHPPKSCTEKVAADFITEIVKSAINLGYDPSVIKIVNERGSVLNKDVAESMKNAAIKDAMKMKSIDAGLSNTHQEPEPEPEPAMENDTSPVVSVPKKPKV